MILEIPIGIIRKPIRKDFGTRQIQFDRFNPSEIIPSTFC